MDVTWYYTTNAGIAATTLLGVEVLKRALGNVSVVMSVPTWVYSVVLAMTLTAVSKSYDLLQDEGSMLTLVLQSVMLAASASGFWTWLRSPGDQIGNSAPAQAARATGK